MALQVWLPLTKDLRQQGLANTSSIILASGNNLTTEGKVGNQCLALTKLQTILGNSSCMTNKKQMSYAYWVKVNTAWSDNWLDGIRWISSDGTTNSINRQEFYTNCTKVGTWFSSSSTNSISGKNFTPGVWTHLAATFDYDTGDVSFYINGVLQGHVTTLNTTHYCRGDFYIGDNGVDISMNDVRIYDHCLSPMEIKKLSQGLILHYPLNRQGWGQENLLLNTQVLTPNSSTTTKNCSQRGAATRQLRSDGFYEAKCTVSWQGLSTWANAQNLVVGQKYTYSFYFYTDGSTKSLSFYPMMYNSSGTRDTSSTLPISIDGGTYQNSNAKSFGSFSNTIPVRHYVTFEWNDTMASIINNGGTIELSIQIHGSWKSGEYGCVYAPKLEIGDKMTPWCPNIADTNNMGLNSTIEYDCSGFCNNGTRTGTFSWTSDTPKYAVSQSFSGSQYIVEPNEINTVDSTIALWVKSALNANAHVLDARNSSAIGKQPIYQYTNGSIQTGGNNAYVTTNTGLLIANTWVHIVLVQSGNSLLVYKNGVLFQTLSCTNSPIIKPTIGARLNFSYKYTGQLSDFRVYVTALSADDVKSLYQNCATIDPDGTIRGQIR